MAHLETDQNLSPEEKNFFDLISHGENFMKIQIYRNARECYEAALKMNVNNELAGAKLADCNAKIKSESKIIIAIVAVLAVVAIALLIIY
ncbi:MAG: hypothetical protein NTZ33_03375 [Bacteroidetes bacterium]|nr:hypothetical protein [Bacteroidota bacterium]